MKTQIAETIRVQIGGRALYMLGAKDLLVSARDRFLQFKVGRNEKGVGAIRITLTPADLYEVTAYKVTRKGGVPDWKVLETVDNVFCDTLLRVLESLTGMYMSL
jgi:hypothetical protein